MALTQNTTNSNDAQHTWLGEVLEQLADHRMSSNQEGTFQFCESGIRINPAIRNPLIARYAEAS